MLGLIGVSYSQLTPLPMLGTIYLGATPLPTLNECSNITRLDD